MPTYTVRCFNKNYQVTPKITTYHNNGALAVQLFTEGSNFGVLSVNLPESADLPVDCFYGKHWSENEGLLEQLVKQGFIKEAEDIPEQMSGFVSGIKAYRIIDLWRPCDAEDDEELL